jgi:hypothetical protein
MTENGAERLQLAREIRRKEAGYSRAAPLQP